MCMIPMEHGPKHYYRVSHSRYVSVELLNVNAKTMNIVLDVSARLTRYTADTATFDGRLGMPQSLQP